MSEREFEAYLNLLARTLKLSEAQRRRIAGELRDHLEARMYELMDQGHDRDSAILAALDEFGDANVLANDLTTPAKAMRQRRLVQTGFGTIAAAALIALAVTYVLPTNRQGHAPQPTAVAQGDSAAKPEASPSADEPPTSPPQAKKKEAGFVYVMGATARAGAYVTPTDEPLTLRQLIASSGGLTKDVKPERVLLRITRRHGHRSELVTSIAYQDAINGEEDFLLQPDDLIEIRTDATKALAYAPQVAVFDLTPIIKAAMGQEFTSFVANDWLLEQQQAYAVHMHEVLLGMGHGNDVRSVTSWMGLMTVVGSAQCIEDAKQYMQQTREKLEERTAASPSQAPAVESPAPATQAE